MSGKGHMNTNVSVCSLVSTDCHQNETYITRTLLAVHATEIQC